jgi:hypothetical protein
MYQGFPVALARDPALVRGIAKRLLANHGQVFVRKSPIGKMPMWGYRFGPPKHFDLEIACLQ